MNPYGQGQWQQEGGGAPSIFGALPSVVPSAPNVIHADSVAYHFTNLKSTVLNSTIVGPQQRTLYRVVTESSAPACTVFKDNESRSIAMLQWQPNATVEIRSVAPQQRVRDWLRLSSDQRCVNTKRLFRRYPWSASLRYSNGTDYVYHAVAESWRSVV